MKPTSGVRDLLCGTVSEAKALPKGFNMTEDGHLCHQVVSDGTQAGGWAARLLCSGIKVDENAQVLLDSPAFAVTRGEETELLFLARDDVTNVVIPRAETACLLALSLTGDVWRALGIEWIAVGHAPIIGRSGEPELLCLTYWDTTEPGDVWLVAVEQHKALTYADTFVSGGPKR